MLSSLPPAHRTPQPPGDLSAMLSATSILRAALLAVTTVAAAQQPGHIGYYRDPAVHGDTVVFTAEGDLWIVPLTGGPARRLTSGTGTEPT